MICAEAIASRAGASPADQVVTGTVTVGGEPSEYLAELGSETLFVRYDEAQTQRKVLDVSTTIERSAEQQARLNRYRWVNRDEGVVAIPIDRAMELVVSETE